MTRHGKNCTAGAVYTYHEKKKDTAASGYGTQNIRLSRDAVKDFDCCCLSLQPCHDPVVTPDGYLYEREAILEYILHQKKEIARQMKRGRGHPGVRGEADSQGHGGPGERGEAHGPRHHRAAAGKPSRSLRPLRRDSALLPGPRPLTGAPPRLSSCSRAAPASRARA
uniref:Nitric oxide synthase-interacting protein n=1 Tax=Sus scrofa TaxID=9823 RepID=A0A8D0Q3F7_PIG